MLKKLIAIYGSYDREYFMRRSRDELLRVAEIFRMAIDQVRIEPLDSKLPQSF